MCITAKLGLKINTDHAGELLCSFRHQIKQGVRTEEILFVVILILQSSHYEVLMLYSAGTASLPKTTHAAH